MKPTVLLINPPWLSRTSNYRDILQNTLPPLGLLSIASYLRSQGIAIHVIDSHVERLTPTELFRRIQLINPNWIGISVMTATAIPSHAIARLSKQACPEAKVVVGGVHAEALPEEMLSNAAIDFVVRGDGEKTLLQLVNGRDPNTIMGISYRERDKLVHEPPSEIEMNIDQFPMPAYDLVPIHRYFPSVGSYRNFPAISMLMTRGCPGACTFCNSAKTVLRTRDAALIADEITHLREKYGIRQINFYDDTFTVAKQNVLKFCKIMKDRRLGVSWCAYIRSDCFNEELAERMRAAGCHQVFIGVETGDDEIARNIGKPISREKTERAVRIAQRHGLEVRASYVLGNVGETPETLRRTFSFAKQLDTDFVQFCINTPYPGTELFRWAKQNRALKSVNWMDYELSGLLLNLPSISESELLKFEARALRKYYLRPKPLLRLLLRCSHPRHLRDLALAFCCLVLKLRRKGITPEFFQWGEKPLETFLALPFWKNAPDRLTYELRRNGTARENSQITKKETELTEERTKIPLKQPANNIGGPEVEGLC